METTFNFEVQRRASKKGTFPIYIRITKDRKHKKIKTSVELNRLSDWNPKAKDNKHIRPSEPHHQAWNEALENEINDARAIYREDKSASIAKIQKSIKDSEHSDSFLEYAKNKIQEASASQSIGTYKHYKTTIQKLEEYLASNGLKDVCFNEITLQFVKGFEAFLGKVENQRCFGRTLNQHTISNYLKKFRKVVNEAISEGMIPAGQNPFGRETGKFKIKADKGSKKEKLEYAEVERIIALHLPEGTMDWHTRNAFLFSFYCAGIRAGDVLQLRWKNVENGSLEYTMGKNGKVRNFKLVAEAEAILALYWSEDVKESDYIFPLLDSNTIWARESYKGASTMSEDLQKKLFNQIASKNMMMNRSLKRIAGLANIKKNLSFHISRHTFAHLAMREGIESAKIQGLLAHSSLKTTETYMGNFSNQEQSEALAKVVHKGKDSQKEAIIEALKGLDEATLAEVLAGLKK